MKWFQTAVSFSKLASRMDPTLSQGACSVPMCSRGLSACSGRCNWSNSWSGARSPIFSARPLERVGRGFCNQFSGSRCLLLQCGWPGGMPRWVSPHQQRLFTHLWGRYSGAARPCRMLRSTSSPCLWCRWLLQSRQEQSSEVFLLSLVERHNPRTAVKTLLKVAV